VRWLILIIVILPLTLSGQNLIDYEIPEVNWNTWDQMSGDNSAKLDFLGKLSIEYPEAQGSASSIAPESAKILDIDGDGSNDMLYIMEGSFSIYLNTGDSLKIIKALNEKLTELKKDWPDAPVNLKTADFSCCEGEEWEFNYYHFLIEEGIFHYRKYRTEIIRRGTKNLFPNMPPTQIQVAASTADLVNGPASLEVISTYQTGRTGYAIASTKGEDGKLWWKVFIKEPDYKLRAGWIERNKIKPVYQSR